LLEEVEVFFDGAAAVGAVGAGLGEGASVLSGLFGGQVADVGLAGLYELDGVFVHVLEVVGGIIQAVGPIEAEPADVLFDCLDVFGLFFYGVGVIEAEVAQAGELVCDAEIEADALCVSDVEVAVWLGWKACLDAAGPFIGL